MLRFKTLKKLINLTLNSKSFYLNPFLFYQKGRKNQGKTNRSARFSGLALRIVFLKKHLVLNTLNLLNHIKPH